MHFYDTRHALSIWRHPFPFQILTSCTYKNLTPLAQCVGPVREAGDCA